MRLRKPNFITQNAQDGQIRTSCAKHGLCMPDGPSPNSEILAGGPERTATTPNSLQRDDFEHNIPVKPKPQLDFAPLWQGHSEYGRTTSFMPGIKRRRSKTNFAPTRKGRVKLIFEMRAIKRTYGRKTSNRPSGRRRFCGVQAFSPKAETLAQAEFTAQPLVALPPYGCGVPLAGASAEHLKSTGRNPKRKT